MSGASTSVVEMATDSVLDITNLDLHYGSSHVLHQVNLSVSHKPLSILGRNGMGKTSLCQAIMGLHRHSAGNIRFCGREIGAMPPEQRAQAGLAYVPQGRRVFRSLTVDEHLQIVERSGAAWNRERVYDTFPRLAERRRNLGDRLSGGEQQMLAISRALLLNPRLILLDEPTEGLAPTIVDDVVTLITNIVEEGIAVVLVEQNMHAALQAVDEVAIMVGGQVVDVLPSEQLASDSELQNHYLGLDLVNN